MGVVKNAQSILRTCHRPGAGLCKAALSVLLNPSQTGFGHGLGL